VLSRACFEVTRSNSAITSPREMGRCALLASPWPGTPARLRITTNNTAKQTIFQRKQLTHESMSTLVDATRTRVRLGLTSLAESDSKASFQGARPEAVRAVKRVVGLHPGARAELYAPELLADLPRIQCNTAHQTCTHPAIPVVLELVLPKHKPPQLPCLQSVSNETVKRTCSLTLWIRPLFTRYPSFDSTYESPSGGPNIASSHTERSRACWPACDERKGARMRS
jgi:hypothetical protein